MIEDAVAGAVELETTCEILQRTIQLSNGEVTVAASTVQHRMVGRDRESACQRLDRSRNCRIADCAVAVLRVAGNLVTKVELPETWLARDSDGSASSARVHAIVLVDFDRRTATESSFLTGLTQSTTSGATNLSARAGVTVAGAARPLGARAVRGRSHGHRLERGPADSDLERAGYLRRPES